MIETRLRRPVLITLVASLLVILVLGALTFHATTNRFDTWAFTSLFDSVGPTGKSALLGVSEPTLSVSVLAVVALTAALLRRWDVAVLTVAGPATALVLTEFVLKPAVGRILGPRVLEGSTAGAVIGSYPSGHESGVASAAMVLLVIVGHTVRRPAVRAGLAALLGVWTVLAAAGLVRNFYHYATDTIGAIGVSAFAVLGSALVIDRFSSPDVRCLPRTSPEA